MQKGMWKDLKARMMRKLGREKEQQREAEVVRMLPEDPVAPLKIPHRTRGITAAEWRRKKNRLVMARDSRRKNRS